jgi:threonine dehydratase
MSTAEIGTPVEPRLVTLSEIRIAADRLRGVVVRTPLLEVPSPADVPARRMLVKPESLQVIGSFKIRGAYNAIAGIPAERRHAGVVAYSSGNHAQGVARAARLLEVRAIIVVPRTIPDVKLARIRADGAEVILHGSTSDERGERAATIARREGLTLIPPYDDLAIIAGQGTVGLEIADDLAETVHAGSPEPTILVPIGGGGLAAGVVTAIKAILPRATLFGVEPVDAADARDSLSRGTIVRWPATRTGRTIADGLRTTSIGRLPFEHLRDQLDGVLTVTDEGIIRAMARAFLDLRLVLEPSGAVALAAMLDSGQILEGRGPIVSILSGGNVDPVVFRRALVDSGTWLP